MGTSLYQTDVQKKKPSIYADPVDPDYGDPRAPVKETPAIPRVGSITGDPMVNDAPKADDVPGAPPQPGAIATGAPGAAPPPTPISATPPPSYAGPMNSAAVPAQQGASTTRMVQYANGTTGAAGSSAGAEHAVGAKMQDPTTGIYTIAGSPQYYDRSGKPIDAVWNGGGLTINGQNVAFNPQSSQGTEMSQGVDKQGRPTSTWTDVGNPNQVFTAHRAATDTTIPGGTADQLYTFEDLLGYDKVAANPDATLESLGVTEQQLIDAGMGSMVDDGSWKTRRVGEQSPFNIQLGEPGAGAVQDGWYEGGVSTGAYHPAGEGGPRYLVDGVEVGADGQPIDPNTLAASPNARPGGAVLTDGNPSTGTGPAGQRPVPTLPGGGDATTGVPTVGQPPGPGYTGPMLPPPSAPNAQAPTVSAPDGITTFGPGNDLRDKQISPTTPAQASYEDIPAGPSAATSQYSQLQSDAANAVGKGASRGDISKQYLDAFDADESPGVRDATQAAIRRAAAVGKIGAGDTAVEAMNPMADYLTRRSAYAKQLAADSAEGDINDRLNNLDAANRTQGQSFGQDVTGRNEARTDRNFTYGTNRDAVTDASNARDELRGERGYQDQMSRQAIEDAVQQYMLEQQGEQQDFTRGNTLAGLGYNNSPSNLLFNAGSAYGNSAGMDYNAFAQSLAQFMASMGR